MKWLLVLLVIGAAAAGSAVFLLDIKLFEESESVARSKERGAEMGDPGAGPDQDLSIEKQFENFLNDFLRGVNTQIKDYKKQRKILAEAIRPVNLRSPTYVEENYTLVQQTAPELRSKMEVLMQTFSRAKEDIESLLSSQPPETRNAILKEWQKMEEKQVSAYISFFMIEEDLIVTHEQLMSFYDQTSATFSVDVSSGEIVFENVEDEVRNRAFLMTIDRLLELQQEAVKNQ